jgi:hypothetical protein
LQKDFHKRVQEAQDTLVSTEAALGVAVWRHLRPAEAWLAVKRPSNRADGWRGYPATKR